MSWLVLPSLSVVVVPHPLLLPGSLILDRSRPPLLYSECRMEFGIRLNGPSWTLYTEDLGGQIEVATVTSISSL